MTKNSAANPRIATKIASSRHTQRRRPLPKQLEKKKVEGLERGS